ncbi:hypothetical protein JCM10450v2_003801 [Rhodotorula kratochvilovae]
MRALASLAAFAHRRASSLGAFDLEEAAPLSGVSDTSDETLAGDDSLDGAKGDGGAPSFPPRGGAWRARGAKERSAAAWKSWAWLAAALLMGVFLGRHPLGRGGGRRLLEGDVREGIWSAYGSDERSAVGTKEHVDLSLPVCERTMLIDWSTFTYGYGSTTVTVMQAGTFAKMHGYTVVFSRGENMYGSYYDAMEPATPLDCRLTEELHQPDTYRADDGTTATLADLLAQRPLRTDTVKRILVGKESIHSINGYIRETTFEMSDLDSLPVLDSLRPKPGADLVPEVFKQRFMQWSALTKRHFSFNSVLRAKLERTLWELGLDKPRDVPAVGVHWRGGDKLQYECRASSQMSCGNVTLHCENAYDALSTVASDYPSFDRTTSKARLLLMTTEPDALPLFQADPLCQAHFAISELPRGGSGKAFLQEDFKHLSKDDRLDDANRMLVQTDILANYVDAAVVSANSNTGRALILLRGGPARAIDEYRIRSVDLYWHPVQYPPFKSICDGTWGGCWPSP